VTIVVGHAPTLGRAAALALAGFEGEFMALKKGGIIWLEVESDGGVVLRGMLSPSQLKADSSS
jgi:phosphohistidine phosphatase